MNFSEMGCVAKSVVVVAENDFVYCCLGIFFFFLMTHNKL